MEGGKVLEIQLVVAAADTVFVKASWKGFAAFQLSSKVKRVARVSQEKNARVLISIWVLFHAAVGQFFVPFMLINT